MNQELMDHTLSHCRPLGVGWMCRNSGSSNTNPPLSCPVRIICKYVTRGHVFLHKRKKELMDLFFVLNINSHNNANHCEVERTVNYYGAENVFSKIQQLDFQQKSFMTNDAVILTRSFSYRIPREGDFSRNCWKTHLFESSFRNSQIPMMLF